MKIIIPVLGFGSAGGIRVLGKLADSFSSKGHDVVILAPKGREKPYFPINVKIIPYYWPLSKFPLISHISLIISLFISLFAFRKSADIYLANYNLTAYPVYFVTLFGGKGFYYIQAYEPDFFDEKRGFPALFGKLVAKFSYQLPIIKIVNASIYKSYKEIQSEYVVEPGIDLDVFYSRNIDDFFGKTVVVGCIGRKQLWKGTRQIIEAVKSVRDEYGFDLKLKVAFHLPDGLDSSEYPFMEIVQPHGDENLAAFYRSNDIFCATGLIQSGAFHYPCMEAMASGVPVISNYSPADSQTAIWLDEVSADKIKGGLLNILNKDEKELRAMKYSAMNKVKLYSWGGISSKMLGIFQAGR